MESMDLQPKQWTFASEPTKEWKDEEQWKASMRQYLAQLRNEMAQRLENELKSQKYNIIRGTNRGSAVQGYRGRYGDNILLEVSNSAGYPVDLPVSTDDVVVGAVDDSGSTSHPFIREFCANFKANFIESKNLKPAYVKYI